MENLFRKATATMSLEAPGEGVGRGHRSRLDARRRNCFLTVDCWLVTLKKGAVALMTLITQMGWSPNRYTGTWIGGSC
jgi:hypothetical protein